MAELRKEITLISGIGQLSTTLLGTGLFMIPALAAGIAQQLTLWAWFILFIAICPIALTFAKLGKRFPNAGGTAYFVQQAFNQRLANSVAWLFVSVIPVGVPAAVALAAGFLQPLLPSAIATPLIAQIITVVLLIIVNLLGTKSSGRLQTLIALSIFALVIALLYQGEVSTADIVMPALTPDAVWPIASALAVMFWCFVGIEAFAHMGEEFKNPERDFPLAIIIGCFIGGATYWACSVVILKYGAYGSAYFETASIPWLSEQLFGEKFGLLISVLGFAACFASINLYTQSLSRMVWAQARQYRPDGIVAKVSERGVPANATLIVGGVLLISSIIGELAGLDLEFFLKLANSVFVFVYLLAMLAACQLLRGFERSLAIVSLILCIMVFLCLGWSMFYAIGVFVLLSLPWRKITRRPVLS